MMEEKQEVHEATINCGQDGILKIEIPLKGGNPVDKEITAYGVLSKAEKMVMQYFIMEEVGRRKAAPGILKPTDLSVA